MRNCAFPVVFCFAKSVQQNECDCLYYEFDGKDSCKSLFFIKDAQCNNKEAIKALFGITEQKDIT